MADRKMMMKFECAAYVDGALACSQPDRCGANLVIHTTAVIDDAAVLGDNVEIGPYCVIGPKVVLGNNVTLKSHVVLKGPSRIGDGVQIYQFATVGEDTPALAMLARIRCWKSVRARSFVKA